MNASQLPNVITLARIATAPVLILLLHSQDYLLALLVFLFAGVSDGLDGFIAKRWNYVSHLGSILDPIADKTLLVSAYVMLALLDHIPFWLMLAVISRDVLIVGGYLAYTSLYGPVQMRPSALSKLNTLAQIMLVLVVLVEQAFALDAAVVAVMLHWTVLVTTLGSGAHYVWVWGVMKGGKDTEANRHS